MPFTPSTAPAPRPSAMRSLRQAVKADDTSAIRSVFTVYPNLFDLEPESIEVWAKHLVVQHPGLAWQVAEPVKSEHAALWAWAESVEPGGRVATRLRSRSPVGHRLRNAAKWGLLEPLQTALSEAARVPAHSFRLAMTYAIRNERLDLVSALLAHGSCAPEHVVQTIQASEAMWNKVSPTWDESQWWLAGRTLAESSLDSQPRPSHLEQAISTLSASRQWPTRLDRMLMGAILYGRPETWDHLVTCMRPEMTLPESVATALEKGKPAHLRQLLKRANADREALRKGLVGGSKARWGLVGLLSEHMPEDIRKQWGRKYGVHFPHLLAEAREHKVSTLPLPPPARRARPRA